jgi:hypothetical protein
MALFSISHDFAIGALAFADNGYAAHRGGSPLGWQSRLHGRFRDEWALHRHSAPQA